MTEAPKPVRVTRAITTRPHGESPLDESGFFKNGKVHDKVHNEVTCGCQNCSGRVRQDIQRGGVTNETEVEMVLGRYVDVANKVHQVKVRG